MLSRFLFVSAIYVSAVCGAFAQDVRIIKHGGESELSCATDHYVGFKRATPETATVKLCPDGGLKPGKSFVVDDLAGDVDRDHPIILIPPAGQTFAMLKTFSLVRPRGRAEVTYYGDNLWGVSAQ